MSLTVNPYVVVSERRKVSRRAKLSLIAGYVWLATLGLSITFASCTAYKSLGQFEEYAYGADPFGYLKSARDIREGRRTLRLPTFGIHAEQIRLLVNFFQEKQVPLSSWRLLVAPQAHLYFPKSGQVGNQYAPGTGLVLALFPEGKALFRLNRAVIILFIASSLAVLTMALLRRSWFGAGFIALCHLIALRMLVNNGTLSFSINAIIPALWLSLSVLFLALWLSFRVQRQWIVLLATFVAGALFGLAIMIRLPAALLGPGFIVLLLPKSFRPLRRNPIIPFGLGVVLAGIVPVLAYQARNTGAWYVSSYAPEVNSRPTLEVVPTHFAFYFQNGPGAAHNWALLASVLGLAGFIFYRRDSSEVSYTWRRLVLSAIVLWILPAMYFVTYAVTTPYYLVPSTFATIALIGMGAALVDNSGKQVRSSVAHEGQVKRCSSLALALLPGIAVIIASWMPLIKPDRAAWYPHHGRFVLPPALSRDPSAWIWADFESGTLWYYANRTAFKIDYGDEHVRAMLYKFAVERKERQYVVADSPYMQTIMEEITRKGGVLEPSPGTVGGYPYFLIKWPSTDGTQP